MTDLVELCDGGSSGDRGSAASAAVRPATGLESSIFPSASPPGSASSAGGASTVPRSAPITISSYISTSSQAAATPAAATAAAGDSASEDGLGGEFGGGADPHSDGGRLDWRRCLEILKEAHLAGVEIRPDLMVLVLSRVPPGNTRKVGGPMRFLGRFFNGIRKDVFMVVFGFF